MMNFGSSSPKADSISKCNEPPSQRKTTTPAIAFLFVCSYSLPGDRNRLLQLETFARNERAFLSTSKDRASFGTKMSWNVVAYLLENGILMLSGFHELPLYCLVILVKGNVEDV